MKFCLATMLLFGFVCGAGAQDGRIVSLSPALTELVCRLGGESRLAGRSSACDTPVSVRDLPVAGQFGVPSLEKLAVLKPDAVIADVFQDAAVRQSIEALGIRVVVLPLKSLDDYRHAVSVLGKMLDAEERAEKEWARMQALIREMQSRHPEKEDRPEVLFVVWSSPLLLPGRKSFLPELIRLAGGDPVGADCNREYFRASAEWVLKTDPDMVIFPGGSPAECPPWFRALRAWKENRIYFPEDAGLFFRLSPRTAEMLPELERMLKK